MLPERLISLALVSKPLAILKATVCLLAMISEMISFFLVYVRVHAAKLSSSGKVERRSSNVRVLGS
jgi:hypothetical protein